MAKFILKNARVAGGDEDRSLDVVVGDGSIEAISDGGSVQDGDVVDCGGLTIIPGYIDVHNHGAVGVDVNEADVDGLVAIGEFLAKSGVTAWLPTLVPDSDKNYVRVIDVIDRLMEIQEFYPIAQAVGVHYEGVFANEKMCGALRPEHFKRFTGAEVESLPRLKKGVHMTTFAPEIEGGVKLAAELARRGWVASIGHTRADVETLDLAFDAGARHVTHFFNAMSGIHHRDVGVAGWALSRSGVTFDIIADGIHVHPRMLELAVKAKTVGGTLLISDSAAPTGLGDGEFDLWGERIVVENGRTRNERGSIAGSVITMHDAAKLMRSIGFANADISIMASENPAKLLGLDDRGQLAAGKRADLIGADEAGVIRLVMIGGRMADL